MCATLLSAQKTISRNGSTVVPKASPALVKAIGALKAATVSTPTVYTDEATFLAAINSNYYLEDFTGLYYGTIGMGSSVLSQDYSNNGFNYTLSAPNGLFSSFSAMSTNIATDPLILTNTNASINYFGGYINAGNSSGDFISDNITVTVGSYTYDFNCTSATQFVGFIFTETISGFTITTSTTSTSTTYKWSTIDHLYVGYTPLITGASSLSTPRNTPLTLSLSDITAVSPKGEALTLNVNSGSNFTVNGTTITPATDFTGTLDVPVTVTDGTATSAVYTLHIDVTLPTAIDNTTTATEGFYPNPCQDGFTVAISSDASLLTISSLTGKVVLKQVVTNGTFVSVGELANGIYVVTLNGKSEKLVIKK